MANRKFVRSAPRRNLSWQGGSFNVNVGTGAAAVSTLVTEVILEGFPNPTIVRMRGSVLLRVSAVGAAPAVSFLTMGIKLVTASALAIGLTAIELPSDEIGSDWIWWSSRPFHNTTALAAVAGDDGEGLVTRVEIDSKAMRKVTPNKVLVFVAQNNASTSTHTIGMQGIVRILLKT